MTPQEDLRALREYVLLNARPKDGAWRYVAKSCDLAADRIDALEGVLRKVNMVYLNPLNDPITVEKRKLLSALILGALNPVQTEVADGATVSSFPVRRKAGAS